MNQCSICDRVMEPGTTDLHHFIPKQCGGSRIPPVEIHKFCHSKIHSLFSNKELARKYHTAELLRSHPDMEKFIIWVSNKAPSYYDKNVQAVNRKKRR
jgi:hypothetical protein